MVIEKVAEDNGGYPEFQFHQPNRETRWETFRKFLYNPETHAVLGRTGKSWGQLLVFYTIFYIVLAALFAICMQGLLATISNKEPTWTLERSLIGTNPGLGFRPISKKTEEGSLIWYNSANHTDVDKWVQLIDEFLEPYNRNQTGMNYVSCDFDKPVPDGKVCTVDLSRMGNCNKRSLYGYTSSSPCIFLKLNRIFGWMPEYFTQSEPDMPENLRMHIDKNIKSPSAKQQIWVSCRGADPIDRENIKDFRYYPNGFASYYYPYMNHKNYLSPIVAVELVNLTPNVVVSIECRAWAKNIQYRGGQLNRAGSIQFEIQMDT